MRAGGIFTVLIVVAVTLVAGSRQAAKAEVVTYNFAGTLDGVSDNTGWLGAAGFVSGLTFSGQFSYNPDAPLTLIGSTWNTYSGGGAMTVSFSQGAGMKDTSSLYLVQDYPTLSDKLTVSSTVQTTMNFSHGYLDPGMSIVLEDSSQTALASRALPSQLVLSLFDNAKFRFIGSDLTNVDELTGTLTSLSAVPLPPSAILFGSALFGLAALRRRKCKAAKTAGQKF